MKGTFFYFLIAFGLISSCKPTAKLYRYDDKGRIFSGQLNDSSFLALNRILTTTTNYSLADTIIVKYDYNNEYCWRVLDQGDDAYIMSFVSNRQKWVQQALATRPNVSVFNFREPGSNINKVIKWDKTIFIDSTRQLYDLLFKEHCICGNSIIVLPDKRFVFIRSDSHSEALVYTQEKMNALMLKK